MLRSLYINNVYILYIICFSISIGNFQVPGRRFFFWGVCCFVLRCTVMLFEVVLLYDLMLLVMLCLSAEVNRLACLILFVHYPPP